MHVLKNQVKLGFQWGNFSVAMASEDNKHPERSGCTARQALAQAADVTQLGWRRWGNSRDKEKGGRRQEEPASKTGRHTGIDWRDRSTERDVNSKGKTVNHLSFPTLSRQAGNFSSLPGVQRYLHQHPPTLVPVSKAQRTM